MAKTMENSPEPSETCKRQRDRIHKLIDPIWQQGLMPRATIYKRLGDAVGDPNFHNRTLFDEKIGQKALAEATKIYTEAINKQFKKGRRR